MNSKKRTPTKAKLIKKANFPLAKLSKQLTDNPTTNEIYKGLLKGIDSPLDVEESKELAVYLIKIAHNSCGLKVTESPFGSHKDLMIRYIQEVFSLSNKRAKQYEQTVLDQKRETFKPAIRCWIKEASNLPTMDADDTVDPYFICYLLGSMLSLRFKSEHIVASQNPIWNKLVIIPIDPELVNSNRGIIVEIWDHDTTSLREACSKLGKSRTWKNFYHGCRDLVQLIGYKCFCGNLVDDKIGQTYVPLNTIPSTEMSLSTNLLDPEGYSVGTIKLIVVWGSPDYIDLTSKLKMIPLHAKIIKYLILWHCREITLKYKDKPHEIPYNSFDFCTLFYIPALTLINQLRLSINIGYWDNVLFCHCVTGLLLLDEIKLERSSTKHSSVKKQQQPRKQSSLTLRSDAICLRTLLISLLTSFDTTDPKRMYENYLIKHLEAIQSTIADEIFEMYKPIIPTMLTSLIEKSKEYTHFHEIIQLLRLYVRYERLFVKYNFRHRLNQILSTILLNYFDRLIVSVDHWSTLISSLETFQETISRYWCQSISSIIASSGQIRVRKSFEQSAVKPIKQIISNWCKDSSTYQQEMLNVYFFVYRLDKLFGGQLIEEYNGQYHDKDFSNGNYVRQIDTIKGLTQRLESIAKPKYLDIKQMQASQSGLFGRLMAIFGKGKAAKVPKAGCHDMVSLLPNSIASITVQAINQIHMKSPQQPLITPRDLEIGQDFRFRDKCRGLGLLKVFPVDLLDKWLEMMSIKAQVVIDKSVDQEMSKDVIKDGTKVENQLNPSVYDVLGCTLYFFVTLEDWGENLLDKSFQLLIHAIESFCEKLTNQTLFYVVSNSSKTNPSTFSLRLIRSLNCLSMIRERYLRRHLVEILTDSKWIDVWNCFWTFFDLKPIFIDDEAKSRDYLVQKLNSTDLEPLIVKRVMTYLILIEGLCHDINILEDFLIAKLSKIFLHHHLEMVRQIVETLDPVKSNSQASRSEQDYAELIDTFADDSSQILSQLISGDIKVNFLLDMRHKLTLHFPSMIRTLAETYKLERKTNKRQSQITRIQAIKLSIMGQGFVDKIVQLMETIKTPQNEDLKSSIGSKVEFSLDLIGIASSIIGENVAQSLSQSSSTNLSQ